MPGINKFDSANKKGSLRCLFFIKPECRLVQTLNVSSNRFDFSITQFSSDVAHHLVRIVNTFSVAEHLQLFLNVCSVLTANCRECCRCVACTSWTVTSSTSGYALVRDTCTVDFLTRFNLVLRRVTDLSALLCEVSTDVSQILIAQVIQQTGHFYNRTYTVFDVLHLLNQILFVLASQLREVSDCTVTIGTVARCTNCSLSLPGSSITCRVSYTSDTQGQQHADQ